jgi:class 3 adenylate cyclase
VAITARSAVLSIVRAVHRVLDWAFDAAIIAVLVLFGLQFPHSDKLNEFRLVVALRHSGDPVLAGVGSWFKLSWPSSSTSLLPLGVAFALWIFKITLDAIVLRGQRLLGKLMPAPQPAGRGAIPGSPDFAGLEDHEAADTELAREHLLKRYREIEQALKGAKRKRCTFLSVDVVGSTQMKLGEGETDIAVTFHAYEELLRKVFEQFGAWKQAWTPDGVMVCFLQVELGVGAAQRVLQSLKKFNESDNRLRTPFRVRCGLNEGEVRIYEDSKLEKVADRVIDVAGHMQKQGTPDALLLSAEVYDKLVDKSGFRSVEQEVDGFKTYEWALVAPQPSPAAAAS